MGGDDHGFGTTVILVVLCVHFCQDDGQCHPFAGAYIAERHIQLQDPPKGVHYKIPGIEDYGVLTAANGDIHRFGTRLREHILSAIHIDYGIVEGDYIPFGIRIGDGFIDPQRTGAYSVVLYGKGQRCPFTLGSAQFRDRPDDSPVTCQSGGTLSWCGECGDPEAAFHNFFDHDVGSTGVGDIPGKILEQFFQILICGRNGNIGRIGIRCPIPQSLHINTAVAHQTQAVNDHTLRFCQGCHRVGRPACGGDTVSEHDHNLCVGTGRVK